jgi:hypothetical protein
VNFFTADRKVTDRNSCGGVVNGVRNVRGIIDACRKFQRCKFLPARAHALTCASVA